MTFIYTCRDNSGTHDNFQSDLNIDERMGMCVCSEHNENAIRCETGHFYIKSN